MKQFFSPLFFLLFVLIQTNVRAASPQSVHCQIRKVTLNEEARETDTNRIYLVNFNCKEDLTEVFGSPNGLSSPFESLNWVNFNKLTSSLIPSAAENKSFLTIEITSAYTSPVLTIDGQQVNFNDESSVIPALPPQQTKLNLNQTLAFGNSALTDIFLKNQIHGKSANGYRYFTDAAENTLKITGETGQNQLDFFQMRNGTNQYIVQIKGDLAQSMLESLQSAGVPIEIRDRISYAGRFHHEDITIFNSDRQAFETCGKTVELNNSRVSYKCHFQTLNMVIQ